MQTPSFLSRVHISIWLLILKLKKIATSELYLLLADADLESGWGGSGTGFFYSQGCPLAPIFVNFGNLCSVIGKVKEQALMLKSLK